MAKEFRSVSLIESRQVPPHIEGILQELFGGAVTAWNAPLGLAGSAIQTGQQAPPFTALGRGLTPVSLDRFGGNVKIIASVPSLDTPVCDAETRRFNEQAATLPRDVQILVISMDLPFGQARWCAAAGVDKVTTLSDWPRGEFGERYGTLIKELHFLARAVFVIDKHETVTHVEYVKEIVNHPDYDAALEAARRAATA